MRQPRGKSLESLDDSSSPADRLSGSSGIDMHGQHAYQSLGHHNQHQHHHQQQLQYVPESHHTGHHQQLLFSYPIGGEQSAVYYNCSNADAATILPAPSASSSTSSSHIHQQQQFHTLAGQLGNVHHTMVRSVFTHVLSQSYYISCFTPSRRGAVRMTTATSRPPTITICMASPASALAVACTAKACAAVQSDRSGRSTT